MLFVDLIFVLKGWKDIDMRSTDKTEECNPLLQLSIQLLPCIIKTILDAIPKTSDKRLMLHVFVVHVGYCTL
jgi:hypothetical protein